MPGPLVFAAIVALCGVVVVFWPSGEAPNGKQDSRTPKKQLPEKHQKALEAFRAMGLSSSSAVGVVDFGDGLGLGTAQALRPNETLLRIPESLVLDVRQTRSCPEDVRPEEAALVSKSEEGIGRKDEEGAERRSGEEAVQISKDKGKESLACLAERAVVGAAARSEISRLTGLLILLVAERRHGIANAERSLRRPASRVLDLLPGLGWQKESGLFSFDEDEFRVFSKGTSMEGWQAQAKNETALARAYATGALGIEAFKDLASDEFEWAYLLLQTHAQWTDVGKRKHGFVEGTGVAIPPRVAFLWPLFLARPTPERQHGVLVRRLEGDGGYEVAAQKAMKAGDEVHFIDQRLTDASALCFRGLWLTSRHRMLLTLDLGNLKRDPKVEPALRHYGCDAQPLRLYVQQAKIVDHHFLGCMRLLAMASLPSKLKKAVKAGWLAKWPHTALVDQETDATAADIAINALTRILTTLGTTTAEARQRYGGDAVAARPLAKVRETETMIVVDLLKTMKELQLVASSEYLFQAMKDQKGDDPDGLPLLEDEGGTFQDISIL